RHFLSFPTRRSSDLAVYSKASRDASIHKTYAVGSILTYRTFTSSWYEATVYVNGVKKTGYIHKSDVENSIDTSQQNIKGIALNAKTIVYSRASTSSAKLKSYDAGTILTYKTFSKNWYEAIVYIKGKATTGYIHKSHVEDAVNAGKALEGIGLKSSTNVYQRASKQSPILKGYPKGSYL